MLVFELRCTLFETITKFLLLPGISHMGNKKPPETAASPKFVEPAPEVDEKTVSEGSSTMNG